MDKNGVFNESLLGKIKKEKLNGFTMSLIKSSLWNWLQGFPCKNTIELFLHISCFINTVFFLLCLWWKNTVTWKWNIKMLIRKTEMIWHWKAVVYRWKFMLLKQYIRYWHLSVSSECCSCLKKRGGTAQILSL